MAGQPQRNPRRAAVANPHGKTYRRPPPPAEQEGRKAWGRMMGPRTAKAIKDAIEGAEKR